MPLAAPEFINLHQVAYLEARVRAIQTSGLTCCNVVLPSTSSKLGLALVARACVMDKQAVRQRGTENCMAASRMCSLTKCLAFALCFHVSLTSSVFQKHSRTSPEIAPRGVAADARSVCFSICNRLLRHFLGLVASAKPDPSSAIAMLPS